MRTKLRKKDRLKLGLDRRIEFEQFLALVECLSRRGKVRILTEMLVYERVGQNVPPCVSGGDYLAVKPFEKSLVPEEFMPAILAALEQGGG